VKPTTIGGRLRAGQSNRSTRVAGRRIALLPEDPVEAELNCDMLRVPLSGLRLHRLR
jgi:hypothetical protein